MADRNKRYPNSGKSVKRDNGQNYRNDSGVRNENSIGFDARGSKRPDIKIADMNGKIYTISGNFPSLLGAELTKDMEIIEKLRNLSSDDIASYPEIVDTLKNWTLKFINLNTYGDEYTMKDVNVGFGDLRVLIGLFEFIGAEVNKYNEENNR